MMLFKKTAATSSNSENTPFTFDELKSNGHLDTIIKKWTDSWKHSDKNDDLAAVKTNVTSLIAARYTEKANEGKEATMTIPEINAHLAFVDRVSERSYIAQCARTGKKPQM
jgi:hypothetical protein